MTRIFICNIALRTYPVQRVIRRLRATFSFVSRCGLLGDVVGGRAFLAIEGSGSCHDVCRDLILACGRTHSFLRRPGDVLGKYVFSSEVQEFRVGRGILKGSFWVEKTVISPLDCQVTTRNVAHIAQKCRSWADSDS